MCSFVLYICICCNVLHLCYMWMIVILDTFSWRIIKNWNNKRKLNILNMLNFIFYRLMIDVAHLVYLKMPIYRLKTLLDNTDRPYSCFSMRLKVGAQQSQLSVDTYDRPTGQHPEQSNCLSCFVTFLEGVKRICCQTSYAQTRAWVWCRQANVTFYIEVEYLAADWPRDYYIWPLGAGFWRFSLWLGLCPQLPFNFVSFILKNAAIATPYSAL